MVCQFNFKSFIVENTYRDGGGAAPAGLSNLVNTGNCAPITCSLAASNARVAQHTVATLLAASPQAHPQPEPFPQASSQDHLLAPPELRR